MIKAKGYFSILLVLVLSSCSLSTEKEKHAQSAPNIIYILADDLGYGDPGCYGQEHIKTPEIDKLAESGIRFTRHYSGSTVCAPSRSVLLTGMHTGYTPIRGNQEVKPEGQTPMPASAITIPEVLKEKGYVSGAFGKWGLGYPGSEGAPENQGFDVFYGYNCQRQAHRYYPEHLWSNGEKVFLEGNDLTNTISYASDLIHEQALRFIENNKDKPFFLYYPIVQPHAELLVPEDSIYFFYLGQFEETPFVGGQGADYGPGMNIAAYCSQENPKATFAAMISRVDKYVGEVVAKLEQLGLSENTVVFFTSDNGPHLEGGADPDFFNSNGGLRGYKRDLYEGGIRVPFIVSWPGTIKAGRESEYHSAFWDMLPTFAELAGISDPGTPTNGLSLLPVLLEEKKQQRDGYLYWEFHEQGGKQAVLNGDWKAIRLDVKENPDSPLELYNLANDPQETTNLAGEHPGLIEEFKQIMKNARSESDLFPFIK